VKTLWFGREVEVSELRGRSALIRYYDAYNGGTQRHWVPISELQSPDDLRPEECEREHLAEGRCPDCLLKRHEGDCS